jgi:hydrogenase maturation protease
LKLEETDPAGEAVLVIGWGSELRGDDAAGLVFVRRLEAAALPGIEIVEVPQLTPELAWDVAAARRVIFVDAALPNVIDNADGHPKLRRLETGADDGGTGRFNPTCVHSLSPERILEMAVLLYGRCAEAWLLCLPAATFDMGMGLSPLAERGVRRALDLIRPVLCRPASQKRTHPMQPQPSFQ